MTMNIEIDRLKKMQQVYDCVKSNPTFSIAKISESIHISRTSVSVFLRMLIEHGHVTRHIGRRGVGGCKPDTFSITNKGRPTVVSKHKQTVMMASDNLVKRKFCKAVQIGVARDAMIAAFFGPVVA